MNIDRKLVVHVAELSHLNLSEAELVYYEVQLGKVLAYVRQLDELDQEFESLGQDWRGDVLGESTPERPDEMKASLPAEEATAAAPRRSGTAFQVPRIIE